MIRPRYQGPTEPTPPPPTEAQRAGRRELVRIVADLAAAGPDGLARVLVAVAARLDALEQAGGADVALLRRLGVRALRSGDVRVLVDWTSSATPIGEGPP